MVYNYQTQKPNLFTEEGQVMFLKVRDKAKKLLTIAGAFRQHEVLNDLTGDGWDMIACVDRLVELGEIEEIPRQCWTQYKIYSTKEKHSL